MCSDAHIITLSMIYKYMWSIRTLIDDQSEGDDANNFGGGDGDSEGGDDVYVVSDDD